MSVGGEVVFLRPRTWTSAAEDAKRVRQAIRQRWGLTSRRVSVQREEFAGGSAVRLTAKAAGVPLAAVARLAEQIAERISRDERTGEILSGGNRYVTSSWDFELLLRVARPLRARLGRLPVGAMVHPLPGIYARREAPVAGYYLDGDAAGPALAGSHLYVEEAADRLARHLLESTPHAVELAAAIGEGMTFQRLG
jgi:hypothetical protein